MKAFTHSRRRWLATFSLTFSMSLAMGCTGGGDTVVSGVGNSGNLFGTAALWDSLAEQLAQRATTPEVTDDEIARVFSAIRGKALEGDLEAALVLLKLAAAQREAAGD